MSGAALAILVIEKYGRTHFYGDEDRNIPARPYVWIPGEDPDGARDVVALAEELFAEGLR